jgi:hypothetical protein
MARQRLRRKTYFVPKALEIELAETLTASRLAVPDELPTIAALLCKPDCVTAIEKGLMIARRYQSGDLQSRIQVFYLSHNYVAWHREGGKIVFACHGGDPQLFDWRSKSGKPLTGRHIDQLTNGELAEFLTALWKMPRNAIKPSNVQKALYRLKAASVKD